MDEIDVYLNGIRLENGDNMVALEAQLGLDKVRINKENLIEKLKGNRSKHKEEYLEAVTGWKKEVVAKLTENLALAKEGKKYNLTINEQRPQDHTKDYDHVISLLGASVDEIVVISAQEFRQYHDDEWRWKDGHTTALSNYSGKHR